MNTWFTNLLMRLKSSRKPVWKYIKSPQDIVTALNAEAAAFYEEKSANEDPIFGEIYRSMKTYGGRLQRSSLIRFKGEKHGHFIESAEYY